MKKQEKTEPLRWAVLGTGVIANQMAQALEKMDRPLYGVANRTYEILPGNMEWKKFFRIMMLFSKIRRWILSILRRPITHIIRL